jgi:hypothetical protein
MRAHYVLSTKKLHFPVQLQNNGIKPRHVVLKAKLLWDYFAWVHEIARI